MSRLCCVVLLSFIGFGLANVLSRTQSFVDHELVPDILSAPPQSLLSTTFPGGIEVLEGNVIPVQDVQGVPTLQWEAEADKLYTVIMCDADAESRESPELRSFLHWLAVNVPGSDIAAGDTIFEFIASDPGPGTGLHRYVFLVYEQQGQIGLEDLPVDSIDGRGNFLPEEFASTHNLGALTAGNFYQTERPDSLEYINSNGRIIPSFTTFLYFILVISVFLF